jgi:predicted amidohydrolase YtcJ
MTNGDAGGHATTVFRNARIHTMDAARPRADALAARGGRLLAVGTEADVAAAAGRDARVVDLGGRAVVPGFVESHCHFLTTGLTLRQVDARTPPNTTIADIRRRVAEFAGRMSPGAWILGWGYDDTLIAERRALTRQDLDEAAPDHPVYIRHVSGHLSYTNSAAIRLAGIGRGAQAPPGGHVVLDARGEPTGELHERPAQALVSQHIPPYEMPALRQALRDALPMFARVGITSVHDALVGMASGLADFHAYQGAVADGDLPLRATLFPAYTLAGQFMFHSGFGDERLRLGPLKHIADGSIQGHTAALCDPYFDQPGHRGLQVLGDKELVDRFRDAHRLGFQLATHGNGDAAIEAILDAYETVLTEAPRADHRFRIEHCQMATEAQLDRMQRLGVMASFFAVHTYYWGDRHERLFLGPGRAHRIDPLASALGREIHFALHSDCPVTPVAPLMSVWSAVNRITREGRVIGPEQRIAVRDALRAFTLDAAYLAFEDGLKGSLVPGKLADFVVLDRDPLAVSPEEIRDIAVAQTVVGGEVIHADGGLTDAPTRPAR